MLIDLIVEKDLMMTLPKELPTLQALASKNYTCADNVFMSSNLAENIISCLTLPAKQPTRTDHYPIDTNLSLTPIATETTRRRNFHNVDWKKFNCWGTISSKVHTMPSLSLLSLYQTL